MTNVMKAFSKMSDVVKANSVFIKTFSCEVRLLDAFVRYED